MKLSSKVELEIMRICQEALTNIKRHSGAHSVQVNLKRINGSVCRWLTILSVANCSGKMSVNERTDIKHERTD
jgi:signal transduction histidine kinase